MQTCIYIIYTHTLHILIYICMYILVHTDINIEHNGLIDLLKSGSFDIRSRVAVKNETSCLHTYKYIRKCIYAYIKMYALIHNACV